MVFNGLISLAISPTIDIKIRIRLWNFRLIMWSEENPQENLFSGKISIQNLVGLTQSRGFLAEPTY